MGACFCLRSARTCLEKGHPWRQRLRLKKGPANLRRRPQVETGPGAVAPCLIVEDGRRETIVAAVATLLLKFSRHIPHEHVPPASGVNARSESTPQKISLRLRSLNEALEPRRGYGCVCDSSDAGIEMLCLQFEVRAASMRSTTVSGHNRGS